jgi:lipopolysaccharide biosynthesis protein
MTNSSAKLIAFYLPQYHPIPENDAWWGPGFTEWNNVTKAVPNFPGHFQPRRPADLGYYDLRLSETRIRQAEMAREYGIYGFCYYHYWFNGKRLLERPFNEVLESGVPDLPFCLCWANENWTRKWNGGNEDVLYPQEHSREDNLLFIQDVIPAFKDDRYIKVDGRPLLLVYRTDLLPNPTATAALWREECRKAGFKDLYLAAVFSFSVTTDPRDYGFDAGVEFPPHGFGGDDTVLTPQPHAGNPSITGGCGYDYVKIANKAMRIPIERDYTWFRGVMPSFDNTARRQTSPDYVTGSEPALYEAWLKKAIDQTIRHYGPEEQFVFINAWNEWAEGNYLEPDEKYGDQYLRATRNAIKGTRNFEGLLQELECREPDLTADFWDPLREIFIAGEKSLSAALEHSRELAEMPPPNALRSYAIMTVKKYPRIYRLLKSLRSPHQRNE